MSVKSAINLASLFLLTTQAFRENLPPDTWEPLSTDFDQYSLVTTKESESGKVPQQGDQVFVHYEGRFTDGSIFDSSIRRD